MEPNKRARNTTFSKGGKYVILDTSGVMTNISALIFLVILFSAATYFVPEWLRGQDVLLAPLLIGVGLVALFAFASVAALVQGEFYTAIRSVILVTMIAVFGFLIARSAFQTNSLSTMQIFPLSTLLFILMLGILEIKASMGGYVFDFDKREMTFPGGAISANNLSEYFKWWFFLQGMMRFTIGYEDIRNINRGTTTFYDSQGDVSSYTHWIRINGNFGAAEFVFDNEAKLEELNSAIVAMNRMGTPVVVQD